MPGKISKGIDGDREGSCKARKEGVCVLRVLLAICVRH